MSPRVRESRNQIYVHVECRTLRGPVYIAIPRDSVEMWKQRGLLYWTGNQWAANAHVARVLVLIQDSFAPNTFWRW